MDAFRIFVALAGLAGSVHAQTPAPGQAYPARAIRMMVPFSPGGASDLAARVVGQKLGERLGQQVVVDNRPGAGGQTRAVNRGPLAGCERPRVG